MLYVKIKSLKKSIDRQTINFFEYIFQKELDKPNINQMNVKLVIYLLNYPNISNTKAAYIGENSKL